MPHIHTQPGQHDLTVSAYIVREVDGEWKCLVHMHKKLHKLLQVGGHVELNETPWQALGHELREESGYELSELNVLQPTAHIPEFYDNIAHPIPVRFMTHLFSEGHYHIDCGYAFIADQLPAHALGAGESEDIRWYSLAELAAAKERDEVLGDVVDSYVYIVSNCLGSFTRMPADTFSLGHPKILPGER